VTTCPACAEAVAPGMTRCPHCGESFVLPPLPRPTAGLPQALRVLAWSLLVLAGLRMASFVQLVVVFAQHGMFGGPSLVTVFGAQLVHTALVVAAGVGLLQARSWAPIVAWLQVASTLFSLGSFLFAFLGLGFGARFGSLDVGTFVLLASLVVALMSVIVLVRPDVRAVFRQRT
jgi:hypothetical protein